MSFEVKLDLKQVCILFRQVMIPVCSVVVITCFSICHMSYGCDVTVMYFIISAIVVQIYKYILSLNIGIGSMTRFCSLGNVSINFLMVSYARSLNAVSGVHINEFFSAGKTSF